MDALKCSLDSRAFLALLKGLSRALFHGETAITYEFLAEQVYGVPASDHDEVLHEIRMFESVRLGCRSLHKLFLISKYYSTVLSIAHTIQLMKKASVEYWDSPKLQSMLLSSSLSEELAGLLVSFWSSEREKVSAYSVYGELFMHLAKSL
jgi:hypothetical protein